MAGANGPQSLMMSGEVRCALAANDKQRSGRSSPLGRRRVTSATVSGRECWTHDAGCESHPSENTYFCTAVSEDHTVTRMPPPAHTTCVRSLCHISGGRGHMGGDLGPSPQ